MHIVCIHLECKVIVADVKLDADFMTIHTLYAIRNVECLMCILKEINLMKKNSYVTGAVIQYTLLAFAVVKDTSFQLSFVLYKNCK